MLALLALTALCVSSQAQTTNFVVDDFSPAGVSPLNPINYDYYPYGTNIYSAGQITNVWMNWYGSALQSVVWDSANDSSNNPASGSMKVSATFSLNDYGQYILFDNFGTFNVNAQQYTNLSFDIRFDKSSALRTNGDGSLDFGFMQVGTYSPAGGGSQDYFYGFQIPATNALGPNTNWVHMSISLNPLTDTNLLDMQDIIFHTINTYYGNTYSGTQTFWVDNIQFIGTVAAPTNPPPTVSMQKSTPALRIFAGSVVDTYDREQLASVDHNQSWVGGTYPVSYSYTLTSFPTIPSGSLFRFHIFLVPVNSAPPGQGFTGNQFIEYNASNDLWLNVSATNPTNVVANVQWKTNLTAANPNNTALQITNPTAVGTWTLTFSSATSGSLTPPGGSPQAFSIPSPAAAQFANPLVAFFGVQPDSGYGEGQYVDVTKISTTGVASPGVAINDNFTTDTTIKTAVWDTSDSAQPASLVLATTNTPYWVYWTIPDTGFANGLGVATNLTTAPWMLPEFYNDYNDGNYIPGTAQQGYMRWTLVPSTCLPTISGKQGSGLPSGGSNPYSPPTPNAFFKLFNPPLSF